MLLKLNTVLLFEAEKCGKNENLNARNPSFAACQLIRRRLDLIILLFVYHVHMYFP